MPQAAEEELIIIGPQGSPIGYKGKFFNFLQNPSLVIILGEVWSSQNPKEREIQNFSSYFMHMCVGVKVVFKPAEFFRRRVSVFRLQNLLNCNRMNKRSATCIKLKDGAGVQMLHPTTPNLI